MHRRPDTELAVLVREGSAEAAGVLFDRYWSSPGAYAVTAALPTTRPRRRS